MQWDMAIGGRCLLSHHSGDAAPARPPGWSVADELALPGSCEGLGLHVLLFVLPRT